MSCKAPSRKPLSSCCLGQNSWYSLPRSHTVSTTSRMAARAYQVRRICDYDLEAVMELWRQIERRLVVIQGEVPEHLQQPDVFSIIQGAYI